MFLSFFGNWAKNFKPYSESFSAELSKLHYTCSGENFEENKFFWKNYLLLVICGPWTKGILPFCWNFISEAVESALYVSRGALWEGFSKNLIFLFIFYEHWAKNSAFFSAMLLKLHFPCQEASLRFSSEVFIHHFRTLGERIVHLLMCFSTGLSRQRCKCPMEPLEKK